MLHGQMPSGSIAQVATQSSSVAPLPPARTDALQAAIEVVVVLSADVVVTAVVVVLVVMSMLLKRRH